MTADSSRTLFPKGTAGSCTRIDCPETGEKKRSMVRWIRIGRTSKTASDFYHNKIARKRHRQLRKECLQISKVTDWGLDRMNKKLATNTKWVRENMENVTFTDDTSASLSTKRSTAGQFTIEGPVFSKNGVQLTVRKSVTNGKTFGCIVSRRKQTRRCRGIRIAIVHLHWMPHLISWIVLLHFN